MDAGGIGAVDGHMKVVALVLIGLDLDRIIGVVLEAEIQLVTPYGGVGADDRHIAAVEGMLVALHNLQIGLQGHPVQRGGQLANAAGSRVDALTILIGTSLFIAAGQGVGPTMVVVGEHLAGHEDGTVDPAGGQINIIPALGRAGALGGTGAQHVLEQAVFQGLGGDLGLSEGDGHGHVGSLLRLIHQTAGLLHVKVHPGDRGDYLVGISVQIGVGRRHADLALDGGKVGLHRRSGGNLGLHRAIGRRLIIRQQMSHPLLQRGGKCLGVNRAASNAFMEHQLVVLKGPGGLGLLVGALLDGLLHLSGGSVQTGGNPIPLTHCQIGEIARAAQEKVGVLRLGRGTHCIL